MLNKVAINTFAKVGSGQSAPQKESDFSNEGYPFIRAGSLEDLLSGRDELSLPRINSDIAKKYKLKLFQPNTIIFAKSGMSALKGRIYKIKNPSYVVNHLATLDLTDKVSPDYILYVLRYFSPVRLIINSAYPSLNLPAIENYEIPLPPTLDDQKRIAKVLSQCDALIQKRKESIDLLDELLRSTFLEMFGDPVRNEKGWKIVPLSKFGSIDRGVSKHRPRNAPELLNGVHPLIQTGDVANAGTYIVDYKQSYSDIGLKQSKKWPRGTLCITIAANIAKTGILTFDACFPDSIVGFVVDSKEATNLYVHHLFSFFQRILEKNAPSAAQKNINLEILRTFKVPQPSIEVQQEFDIIALKVESLKRQFKQSLKELENLYGSISQRAFNGELDLSKVDISDMEKMEQIKPEIEPVGEPHWEGNVQRQNYNVNIDEIIKNDFPDSTFSFKELEAAILERAISVPYENIKSFVFKSLEGENPLLEQLLDDKTKTIFFKLKR